MKIALKEPWTYRTPLATIEYDAGEHEVDEEIGAAAVAAGVIEGTDNGDGTATPRATRAARSAEN